VPLKRETLSFFEAMVLPVHSSPRFFAFTDQLCECLAKVFDKQSSLLGDTLQYMFNHWPYRDWRKQEAFLSEAGHFLVKYTKIFGAVEVKWTFRLLNLGLYNECSDIVDQAIDIMTGGQAIDIIMKYPGIVYPIIYTNLCRCAKFHWDSVTKTNAFTALQALQAIDSAMFKQMGDQRETVKREKTEASKAFQTKWKLVLEGARANDPTIANHSFPRL
jgi:hypothetical protein